MFTARYLTKFITALTLVCSFEACGVEEPESEAQDGVAQDGVAQDGVAQDGVAQDGVAQDGVAQDGVAQDSDAEAAYVYSRGFHTTNCSDPQHNAIHDAWVFLTEDLKKKPLKKNFTSCVQNAVLVEANCVDQGDRSAIINDVFAEQVFEFECYMFKEGMDANGNPVQGPNADAHVGIKGTKMRINPPLLGRDTTTIASVIAHELMHNRGYEHESHDFGQPLYELTVPEQVEKCVLGAASGGAANPNPTDHWDERLTCVPGSHWCDSNGCYKTLPVCVNEVQCYPYVVYEDGSPIPVSVDPVFPNVGF